ncbi:replication protein A 70 kDa DNA-binding subunit B [Tanacetum coccineum]
MKKVICSSDMVDLEAEMPKKKSDGKDDWFCTKCNVVSNIKIMLCLQIRVQDENGTMSLTLWNDEVQPIVDMYSYQLSENNRFTAPSTIDICVHHGGRILTANKLYDYWDGEEHMICNVKTRHVRINTIEFLVRKHLSQYTDVIAYYFRVLTVEMSEDWSLQKVENDILLPLFLEDIQIGHALDLYLVQSSYPVLIDPNTKDGYIEIEKK